ncbi:MAG: DUF4426 domain-containing protein [Pseudomonas sp.]|uniref:DUF4426 domain-containing protein n=1 Tax=Pseudomonas sp. TaxID=306 RepID=UPI00339B2679
MRRLVLLIVTLCLALPAAAERKQTFGDLDVHYSAFNSAFLQPDIAAATGLVRSKQQGVLNVAVLQAGHAVPAQVSGEVKNLLGQSKALTFKMIKEDQAVYYLSQFPFEQQEVLRFNVQLQVGNQPAHSFDFTQEFFPEP